MSLESSINVKEVDKESLLKESEKLRFKVSDIHAQILPVLDYVELNAQSESVATLKDLTLELRESETIIVEALSNFLEETSANNEDLLKLKKAVEELESSKDKVLTEFRRFGYGNVIKKESSKSEDLNKEANKEVFESRIRDLKQRFFDLTGEEEVPGPLKLAERTMTLLDQIKDSDPNVIRIKQQKYFKTIGKMLGFAESDLAELVEKKAAEEVKPQEKKESISPATLIELYRTATDGSFFKGPNSKDGDEYKDFQDIALEIQVVLDHSGFDDDEIMSFNEDVLVKAKNQIVNYDRILSAYKGENLSKKKKDEKARLMKELAETYDLLLKEVHKKLVVPVSGEDEKKADSESSSAEAERSLSPVEEKKYNLTSDEIKAELSICQIEFKQLNTRFTEKFGEDIAREHLSKVQEILDLIANEKEEDLPKLNGQLTELVQRLSVAEEQFNTLLLNNVRTPDDIADSIGNIKYSPEEVQSLYNLYRAADSNVFKDPKQEDKFKRFHVISKQIKEVLEFAGLTDDAVDEFMEDVDVIRHNEIADLYREMNKPENIKDSEKYKQEIAQKYQELLTAVSKKLNSPDGWKLEPKATATPEEIEKHLRTVKTFEDLYEVLDQLGGVQGFRKYYSAADLKSGIAGRREEVKSLIKTYPEVEKSAIVEMIFNQYHPKFPVITNSGGLRQLVRKLIEEENGIGEVVDVPVTPASNVDVKPLSNDVSPRGTESHTVSSTSDPLKPKEIIGGINQENRELRKALFASKEKYLAEEKKYQDALKKYYEESWWGKLRQAEKGVKNFFGIAPELPKDLMALKKESKELRLEYAKAMDAALTGRNRISRNLSSTKYENGGLYSLDSDRTKTAFVEHFILRPNQYSLNLQKEKLSPEVQSSLLRIMSYVGKTAAKNRWKIRAGVIAVASLAGLATGGVTTMVAAGALKLGKILTSAEASLLAAGTTNALMQMRTVSAGKNLKQEIGKFSLDNMQDSEDAILKAKRSVVSKEQQQTAATIAAGILAGGLTGYGMGAANAEALNELREMSKPDLDVAETPKPGTPETSEVKPKIEQSVELAVNDNNSVNTTETTPATEKAPEILPGEPLKLNDQFIPNEGLNKEYGATAIKNVRLIGAFDDVTLTTEEQAKINDFIKREAQILAVNPNTSEIAFERFLFLKMSEQLGQENWWIGAQPKGIDLDLLRIDTDSQGSVNSADDMERESLNTETDSTRSDVIFTDKEAETEVKESETATPVAEPVEEPPTKPEVENENRYTVQRGDNLWKITAEHFKDELKNVPPDQYNQVLDRVFDNIRVSDELKNSLGIRSGDIDLIYPNEELNLSAVGEEIKRVLADKYSVDIDVSGAEGENLNIEQEVTNQHNFENLSTANDSGWRGYEITPEQRVEAMLKVPDVAAVDGQYFTQPEWGQFITNHYGNEAAFNKVLNAEVAAVDNLQSDWLGRLFGGSIYDSPYQVMGKMTMEDLAELREGDNFNERAFCQEHNLKYETYLDWQDRIAAIGENYEHSKDTTWADIFKRHVAETKSPLLNKLSKI